MSKKRASLTSEKTKSSLNAVGFLAHFDSNDDKQEIDIEQIPLEQISSNPFQPRHFFDENSVDELKQSIKQFGFYGSLLVRRKGRKYELVYGERRFRAAQKAGLSSIPVEIRELSDDKMLEIALSENIQREDLTAVEEAQALHIMHKEMNMSIREIAKKIGKSVGYISSLLSILRYPEIKQAVLEHDIPIRTAEELSKITNEQERQILLQKVIAKEIDRKNLILLRQSNDEKSSRKTKKISSPIPLFTRTFHSLQKQDPQQIPQQDKEKASSILKQIIDEASSLLEELQK